MQTIMDKEKNRLLKRFHALLGRSGGDVAAKKEAILDSYGVESSRDMDAHQLLEACASIERGLNPSLAKTDRLRKRLLASIGGWLRAMGKNENIELIKAIACRAANVNDFNKISDERLQSLYYAFRKKQSDLTFVDNLTRQELDYLISMN